MFLKKDQDEDWVRVSKMTRKEIDFILSMAMRLPLEYVVVAVSSTLTRGVVAYMCGKNETFILDKWINNEENPTAVENLRLRYGYAASEILRKNYDAETARAIFMGMNPALGDEAPASWLRDHEDEKDLKLVVSAALNDEMCS